MPIQLSLGEDVNLSSENVSGEFKYYCSELGGKQCNAGETCSGQSKETLDGRCCLANCLVVQDDTTSSWIGYLLAIVALGIVAYVWIKYKKAQPAPDIVDKAVEKGKNIP